MTKSIIISDYKKATEFIKKYADIIKCAQTMNGYTVIFYKI